MQDQYRLIKLLCGDDLGKKEALFTLLLTAESATEVLMCKKFNLKTTKPEIDVEDFAHAFGFGLHTDLEEDAREAGDEETCAMYAIIDDGYKQALKVDV